ncbi:3-hydroxyacyl-CoA dehydrogenase NAD-binding domain-containing protein [Agrococcus sp. SCSIO52902]|uniref:3-hydroxyacyl-CoA dehydrogenase NAD-binding domain-containing protein n=1 Tax=Agrococcus sp. SCSIO52902 TaxID=2933290 RepID=UPI001FF4C552|nr:3-hydroxyacyl-CoA dehydrogenase NAD-binding domain-containing protein [Agrococcus sp. SCSIO52902]UOW00561.1 3-hydroxyacyl-CoA dehydrogenase NAD-binding domain-containing protein [Agrococcus sp. SCSIO52902]
MAIRDEFPRLAAAEFDEVVTHSHVRDVQLASGRTLALITLDNGRDHTRPSTLGPATLFELGDTLEAQRARGAAGEVDAIAVTGKPYFLAAGADLSNVGSLPDRETAAELPRLGHRVLGLLHEAPVPTFVFINGLALGGGLEIGLNADYRTISSAAPAVALPETFLGLVPGWGGATILPNLIGIERALKVIIENPLKQRVLKPADALELGIADAMFGPASFLESSLRWADGVLGGAKVDRPHVPGTLERTVKWPIALKIARETLEKRIGKVALAPYRALDVIELARKNDRAAGFAAEDAALADLIPGDQFVASIYAFDLVQKRAKRPAGAPDAALAKPVTKVGIIGAGLMASQFALLFLRRLQVPVVITDLDQGRVDAAVARIRGEIDALAGKGRITTDEQQRLSALISGTVDKADFAGCDWVIEAVFEELGVKQQVFAEIEPHLSETAVIATNTSSLSVEQIGARLAHPERLVGFHFFNPVAVMPLIEVVRTPATDDATLATAMRVAKDLKKNAVITRDTPGFVVNRVLAKLLGEAMHAVEQGSSFEDVVEAQRAFGFPMDPFVLLDLVGLKVGAHVLDTHHGAFPDRFFESKALHELAEQGILLEKDGKGEVKGIDKRARRIVAKHRPAGAVALSADELRVRIEDGLADEIKRMLDDHVVEAAEDIDLCMILGAGWPFQMGGITPYLDRVGASERVFGGTFHQPPIAGPKA